MNRYIALGIFISLVGSSALAETGRVNCPVIVDRETGKYASAKSKYYCYSSSRHAKRSGFSKFSFSDDSCNSGGDSEHQAPGLSLAGPGEKISVVFSATAGGTVQYSFPGGGDFEISLINASTNRRIEKLLETSQASSGTLTISAQTSPVYIKAEGPGSWTAVAASN